MVKSADQITIIDVTDAYSVMLTSEAYTFVGGNNGVGAGESCTTEAVAFCGSNQCTSVIVTKESIVCPPGITASVENSGSTKAKITFLTTETINDACEAVIPVVVDDITVNKKFSFAIAKAGTAGTSVTVASTSVKYAASSNGTTAPTSGWTETIPAVPNGQYLWTQTVVTYSDGKYTEAYSVSYKGTNGSDGEDGTSVSVSSTSVQYQAGSSGTTEPTGTWKDTVPTVPDGEFLWTRTIVTYSDGTATTSYSVSYKAADGKDGEDGQNGEDAITLTITSSNGTVFKNNSGSTILTAHVWKGSVEQAISDNGVCGSLGSIKWYKSGTTAPLATAKSLTVSANDVTNSQAYTCQLES